MPKTLTGTIQDSTGNGVTGKLFIKVDAPIIDTTTTPDRVIYGKETQFNIVNGSLTTGITNAAGQAVANITLQESDTITYTFRFTYQQTDLILYLNGVEYTGYWHKEGNNYFTGEVTFAGQQALTPFNRVTEKNLFDPFSAKIPTNAPNPLEWASIQPSGVNSNNVDTSLFAIAQLITNTANLLQNLVAGIYNPRGVYSGAATYTRGDVVYDPNTKGSYWYIYPTDGNAALTATAYWQTLITSTEVTSSTVDFSQVLHNTAYGATWNNLTTKAPTANALYAFLQGVARLSSADFQSITMPTRPAGDNTQNGANTAFVRAALTAYTPPTQTTAPDIPLTDQTSKIVNSRILKQVITRMAVAEEQAPQGSNGGLISGGFKNRIFEFLITNQNSAINGLTGGFVQLPANGKFWIEGFSCVCGVDRNRIVLIDSTGNFLLVGRTEDTGLRGYALSARMNNWSMVSGYLETGASALNITLRHYAETTGRSEDSGRFSNFLGNEVYARMVIFRLD